MNTFNYSEVSTTIEADVIVLGAGPGGLGAAVTSARNGADTVIIERFGGPGGMAVYGEVCPFMYNHVNGETMDTPVYAEWRERIISYVPNTDLTERDKMTIGIPEAMLAAEDLLLEAGVRPAYHHELFDVEVKDGMIERVILFSKSGLTAAKGKVYIDCTGDADVAAKAGCEIAYGNDDGLCQPMTTCFKLEDIDREVAAECCRKLFPEEENPETTWALRKVLTKVYNEAKENGEVDCPREDILEFPWFSEDVIHFNTTRVIKHHATDGLSLSDAEVLARKQIRQLLKLFREKVPGFERARLRSIAAHVGVRESRRVMGRNYVSDDMFDFENESFPMFEDAIARVSYPIDIHNPNGSGTILKHFPKGTYYEIPYGCIVPKLIDNLLIGGRPISVDHPVHSSMRVMPPACTVGQAAGMAAAMAVKAGVNPPEINGCALREELKKYGAFL